MQTILLLILAIIPAFVLLRFILRMDKIEPEPISFVLFVMLMGAVSVIPAAIIEVAGGFLPIFRIGGLPGAFLQSFLLIGPVEEFVKMSVVMLIAWNNVNFNEENDGIVYMGSAALGFAMFENIFYVLQKGFAVGLLRSVTAVPLHCFTGIIMGYYIGLAKFSSTPDRARKNIFKGFFIAYFIHAAYDTVSLSSTLLIFIIVPVMIGLVIYGVMYLEKGKKLSMARWQGMKPSAAEVSAQRPSAGPDKKTAGGEAAKNHKATIYISRALFAICILFDLMMFAYYLSDNKKQVPSAINLSEFRENVLDKIKPEKDKDFILSMYKLNIPTAISKDHLEDELLHKIKDANSRDFVQSLYEPALPGLIKKNDFDAMITGLGQQEKNIFLRSYIMGLGTQDYYLKKGIARDDKDAIAGILQKTDRSLIINYILKDNLTNEEKERLESALNDNGLRVNYYLPKEPDKKDKKRIFTILHTAGYLLSLSDIITSVLVFTTLPMLIGILLEVHYFRARKAMRPVKTPMP